MRILFALVIPAFLLVTFLSSSNARLAQITADVVKGVECFTGQVKTDRKPRVDQVYMLYTLIKDGVRKGDHYRAVAVTLADCFMDVDGNEQASVYGEFVGRSDLCRNSFSQRVSPSTVPMR